MLVIGYVANQAIDIKGREIHTLTGGVQVKITRHAVYTLGEFARQILVLQVSLVKVSVCMDKGVCTRYDDDKYM